MTTIILDDQFINEVMTVSHYQSAQEAVIKILANYLRQHKAKNNITELLAMPDATEIDFNPSRLTQLYHPTFI